MIFVQIERRGEMRTMRMWYGLLLIWITRQIKNAARQAGEWGKVKSRKLIAWGEDRTPRWNRELFHRCYLADVEIHLPSGVVRGNIDVIYQEFYGTKSALVLKLKGESSREFRLVGYGAPVVIKEHGYDCVWTGCDGGYVAIFFKRPRNNKRSE
jgi:hypothetical protein